MNLSRYLSLVLAAMVFVGCGPGIRFRPGEIPAPSSTAPEHLEEAHQLHQQIIREMPVLRDPQAVRRVSRILDRILDVTPATGHWTVTLIDNPAFNAMTTPGNFVYVFKGMLDQARSDDEVAAVLAHEIGHRLAQHELKTTEQALGEAIAMIATVAAGVAVASQQGSTRREVADVMNMTRTLGAGFTTLRYEKDQEREADQIGMFLIADAGINPIAAADVWAGRLSAEGGGGSDFFSTHPLHEDRYAMALQLLPVARVRYEAALKRKKHGRGVTRKAQSSPALYSHLAQAQEAIANDDLVTASTIAHSLVSRQPSSPEVHNLLGSVQLLQGDLGQAQKAFQRGLKLAPKDPTLLYNLACMHVRKGEHAAALRSLESAFMQNPALVDTAQSDSDLESLHDDENFKDLISRQYSVPAPQNVGGNTYSIN